VTGPRTCVVDDGHAMSSVAADLVADVLAAKPSVRVVAATGRTPMGLYAELADRRTSGRLDLSTIIAYQLDEYLGLEGGDRRSLFGWMRRAFVEPLGVAQERVVRLPLDGGAGDLAAACTAFDDALNERGGLDLAILGLGSNGHVGFNEPPSGPNDPTRAVELTEETIEANARYWGDDVEVPTMAVTMGMRPLLEARRIVLLASGEAKREIVHRALEGPIEPAVPASFLRECDAEVVAIVDRAAWGEP
jgi:glucosamine-6-phosphate deaminase